MAKVQNGEKPSHVRVLICLNENYNVELSNKYGNKINKTLLKVKIKVTFSQKLNKLTHFTKLRTKIKKLLVSQ